MTTVDIVIPVYNEQHSLPVCMEKLIPFCRGRLKDYQWRVVVANNGSTDNTWNVVQELAQRYPGEVTGVHLDQKGRGRALRKTWLESPADVMCYMDVDLSTDIRHIPRLINAVAKEGYDVATGSRLQDGSETVRSIKREITSRGYNALVKAFMQTRFSDAQCGFKAITRQAAQELLPLIKNLNWFWDTELLILAEKNGYRVADFPVVWGEDPDTRVKIVKTATEDVKGLIRLRFGGVPRPKKTRS